MSEIKKHTKNGYQMLRELCAIPSRSSFNPEPDPNTTRVEYIIAQLKAMNLPYETDVFPATRKEGANYINIYIPFLVQNQEKKIQEGVEIETVVFLAHHDIANPNAENCNDNTASVCNLLDLCAKLDKNREKLTQNIIVCIVDSEEIVFPPSAGSGQLGRRILSGAHPFFMNVKYAVNLELTAYGDVVWVDTGNLRGNRSGCAQMLIGKFPTIERVGTPYSDSFVLRMGGIDSMCIGTFTQEDRDLMRNGRMCPTWALCHREEDRYENANQQNMTDFVNNVLFNIAMNEEYVAEPDLQNDQEGYESGYKMNEII